MDDKLRFRRMAGMVVGPDYPEVEMPIMDREMLRIDNTGIIRSDITAFQTQEMRYRETDSGIILPPLDPKPMKREIRVPTSTIVVTDPRISMAPTADVAIRASMPEAEFVKLPTLPAMSMDPSPMQKIPQIILPKHLRPEMMELPRMEMEQHYEPVVETIYPDILPSDWQGLTASTSPYGAFGVYSGRAFGESSKAIGLMIGEY